jgi:hypothetical protein
MEATPPATPRHTMLPLRLLPSRPDQMACKHARLIVESLTALGLARFKGGLRYRHRAANTIIHQHQKLGV